MLDTYIPDRYKEGYGISTQGIDYAEDNNISLIIALDCGVKAIDKIAYANEKNIDFIICDTKTRELHCPKRWRCSTQNARDCNYPFNELSGCRCGL